MAKKTINMHKIALLVGAKLVEVTTRQENIPFQTGDLRKSITFQTEQQGNTSVIVVGSNLPYARAVHDGRPALTIYAKNGGALFWAGAAHPVKKVQQPARPANPFITRSIDIMQREGLQFVAKEVRKQVEKSIKDRMKD